jgi:MFS family permease
MTVRWSRVAVAVFFFINGAVLASWVPHIPAIKTRHILSDGALGIVLLSMAAGSVLALPVAGWLVGRLGSRVPSRSAKFNSERDNSLLSLQMSKEPD